MTDLKRVTAIVGTSYGDLEMLGEWRNCRVANLHDFRNCLCHRSLRDVGPTEPDMLASVSRRLKALGDSDLRVRWNAAEALGKIGDGQAVAPLISALADAKASVWTSALVSLVRIGEPAIPSLTEAMTAYRGTRNVQLTYTLTFEGRPVPEEANVNGKYEDLLAVVNASASDQEKFGRFYDHGDGKLAAHKGFFVLVGESWYCWKTSHEPSRRQHALTMLALGEIYGEKPDEVTEAKDDLQGEGPGSASSPLQRKTAAGIRHLAEQMQKDRQTAARADQDDNDILAMALASKDHGLQFTARDLIMQKHDPTIVPVLKRHRAKQQPADDDILSRINYNSVLAELGDMEGVRHLRQVAAGESSDPAARLLAQTSLVRLGDFSILPDLRKQLAEEDPYRRYPAASAILLVIKNAREREAKP